MKYKKRTLNYKKYFKPIDEASRNIFPYKQKSSVPSPLLMETTLYKQKLETK
jgi:hypothetical protein